MEGNKNQDKRKAKETKERGKDKGKGTRRGEKKTGCGKRDKVKWI